MSLKNKSVFGQKQNKLPLLSPPSVHVSAHTEFGLAKTDVVEIIHHNFSDNTQSLPMITIATLLFIPTGEGFSNMLWFRWPSLQNIHCGFTALHLLLKNTNIVVNTGKKIIDPVSWSCRSCCCNHHGSSDHSLHLG